MKPRRLVVIVLGVLVILSGLTLPAMAQSQPIPVNVAPPQLVADYGKLPLSFEANRGQTDSRVQFISRGQGYTLFLTSREAVLSLGRTDVKPGLGRPGSNIGAEGGAPPAFDQAGAVVRMRLLGSNPKPAFAQEEQLPGKSNYFIGNDPAKWRTNVPNYSKVRYREVYPGIDLVYYGNQQRVEHDFVVAPGADPGRIRFRLRGVSNLRLDAGDLVIQTTQGELRLLKPDIYQMVAGKRREVAGGYRLAGGNQVGFEIGAFDHSQPLVIDPVLSYVLSYSTFLGGSGDENGFGIAVDAGGNVYVTGITTSTGFPTTPGAYQTTYTGASDAFVTKLSADGKSLVYSTYLGGAVGFSNGSAIAVDSNGNAYVAGQSNSTTFPITSGAAQTAYQGSGDAFVTKLKPDGSGLIYSTYLGGSGSDTATGIAVDSNGYAYVIGYTQSTETNFPITAGAFQTTKPSDSSHNSPFVTKLRPDGSGWVYSTYLGGNNHDYGYGIAIDSSGYAYVTGSTSSSNFPVTAGAFQTLNGSGGGFAAKLKPDGSDLIYATYLGNAGDKGTAIAVNPTGNAYVTGSTITTNTFFGTPGAYQITNAGGWDAFVAKLKPDGSGVVYSTYLGGSAEDQGNGIAVDSSGYVYVAGYTLSTNFPYTADAYQTSNAGNADVFVTKLSTDGTSLLYSTYLGGSNEDKAQAIAVDSNGNAYITGHSMSPGLPTTTGAFEATYRGGAMDAFVAKIGVPDFTLSANPTSLTIGWGSSGHTQLTVTPQNTFSQTVSFACSGLPTGATCAFSPTTLTPTGSAIATTLTISAPATSAQHRNRHLPWTATSAVLAICSLGLGTRRSPKLLALLLLITAMAGGAWLIGCGSSPAPPASSQYSPYSGSFTVTATAGSLQHQATVTLSVQ